MEPVLNVGHGCTGFSSPLHQDVSCLNETELIRINQDLGCCVPDQHPDHYTTNTYTLASQVK